ncbi:MAG: serine hydroxymethyltransferase [Patescibacteria group bacterium]
MKDKKIETLCLKEERRQRETLNLIPSENYVSRDVLHALGSIFVNKYSEGYPGARYYGGNEVVDTLENLTQERALKLFHLSSKEWSANVQPYSGSPANLAVYAALVPPGGVIMGMELAMGGHLTHGHNVSLTGRIWQQLPYGVDSTTETLDFEKLAAQAREHRPALIVAGYTAYSRIIDFAALREVANSVSAKLLIDLSHVAGLVAGGVYPSPFPHADVVMTTTHKTLRGPRAAIIFSRGEHAKLIDRAVFPGVQGGPHNNQIAAVAVALSEASKPEFKRYAKQVVKNAQVLAQSIIDRGWRVVSGGTDTHLFLIDTMTRGVSGREAERLLGKAGIIVNKNAIPFDMRKPFDPSGIRVGTPALTTRGMKEGEMVLLAGWIDDVLRERKSPAAIRKETLKLAKRFRLP